MAEDPILRLPLDDSADAEERTSAHGGSFEQLRHLILAPEQEDLARLRERVENSETRTKDLSAVLPEAIQMRRAAGGEEALGAALGPTLESALRESVKKDPHSLADALFPVMGPAIRRSIQQTLRSLFESFNEAMEHSLSLRGLQWRFEALRTGRTFSEIILMHSLLFRVEQVFLIHKKTGLPLAHAVAPAVAMQDASLISGMLSAIQDFVRDSFHSPKGEILEKINVGELEVWVEDGPYAILASVIRGIPPPDYRLRMVETLEKIHRNFAGQMEKFAGDTGPFAATADDLSRCLEFKYKEKQEAGSSNRYALVVAALAAILLAGWLSYRLWENHRWGQFVETLRAQPGLVVTGFDRQHGRYVIRGLRDPLAADPSALLHESDLDAGQGELHWAGYYAMDDAILVKRSEAFLMPPAGVKLTVVDGVLRAEGTASTAWLATLRERALLVPGVRTVDLSQLMDADQAELARLQRLVQAAVIRFPLRSSTPSPGELEALNGLAPEIRLLFEKANLLQKNLALNIVGHSDSSGEESTNKPLSQSRADRVLGQLTRDGVDRKLLRSRGVASSEPLRSEENEEGRQYNRSVTFSVVSAVSSTATTSSVVPSAGINAGALPTVNP
jgi:outer membrane protein OmpA-like peptidoglycan-associated protein